MIRKIKGGPLTSFTDDDDEIESIRDSKSSQDEFNKKRGLPAHAKGRAWNNSWQSSYLQDYWDNPRHPYSVEHVKARNKDAADQEIAKAIWDSPYGLIARFLVGNALGIRSFTAGMKGGGIKAGTEFDPLTGKSKNKLDATTSQSVDVYVDYNISNPLIADPAAIDSAWEIDVKYGHLHGNPRTGTWGVGLNSSPDSEFSVSTPIAEDENLY